MEHFSATKEQLGKMPLPVRWMIVGAGSAGALGGIAGLIVGLVAYPQTAWFAVLEAGIPAAVLGALVGLFTGSIVAAGGWLVRRITSER